ncbi:MAG: amino acid racemase [Gammaproteobacteria bacterium]|nr:amino acid racemase [Gammaproteobacteria bacterium]
MGDKTVGIIGGMGPEATADLLQRIIKLTPATDDSDHIHCIIDNNPKIPSRIKAIIDGNGEDPSPFLAKMAVGLENSGADFLAIPCNTAHYYYDVIQEAVNIPILHITDVVLKAIRHHFPDYHKIGVLASPAVQITKLYEDKFSTVGLDVTYPDVAEQALLFQVIKDIKSNINREHCQQSYHNICSHLVDKGAELLIIACTELSILETLSSVKTIDAVDTLANEIITQAKGNC